MNDGKVEIRCGEWVMYNPRDNYILLVTDIDSSGYYGLWCDDRRCKMYFPSDLFHRYFEFIGCL